MKFGEKKFGKMKLGKMKFGEGGKEKAIGEVRGGVGEVISAAAPKPT